MSEESIVVEVEVESIKTQPADVNVLSSTVLKEEIPFNTNNSEDLNVEDTISTFKDEEGDQNDVKERLLWDKKTSGSNELDGRHARRHSASPLLFVPNKKAVVPSRYRGGSVGSCHDMCKSGHKNTSEVKPKSFIKKTPVSINASEGKRVMKIALSKEDNRRNSVVRRLSFPATKGGNESQMNADKLNKMSEPKQKPTVAQHHKSVGEDEGKAFESCTNGFREIKVIKDEEKSSGLVGATLRSKQPVKKAATMNTRMHRDLSSSSHLKNHQTNRLKEAKGKSPEDVPEKTLYMIEPNSKSTIAERKTQGGSYDGTRKGCKATQNGSHNSRLSKPWLASLNKSSKWHNVKLDDTELVFKRTSKPNSSTPEAKSYTSKLKLGAPKAKQNGKQNSHLIKASLPAIDKPSTFEDEKQPGTESVSKHGDANSRDSKTKPNAPKAKLGTPRSKPGTSKLNLTVDTKAKVTKGGNSQNGEGESIGSVWKMKFKRGKVISLPSGNNSPVKLKFRRPKSFSDSRYAENANKANYKNNEVNIGEDQLIDGAEPVKVVLRRHEAAHKKDDLDLNNVIEETASKLVKTRKSKVKALVGAFETVMSLRDRKASETTTAP